MGYRTTLRASLAAVLAVGAIASTPAQATYLGYYPYPVYGPGFFPGYAPAPGYFPGYYPGWRPGYALPPYLAWYPVPPALHLPFYPLPPRGHFYGRVGLDLLLFGPNGLVHSGHPNFFRNRP
jgi:hypothetical protein